MKRIMMASAVASMLSVATVACNEDPVSPLDAVPELSMQSMVQQPFTRVMVFTFNAYVGADLDAVIAALVSPDPTDDFSALLTAINTLQFTSFATRAKVLADKIARSRPHVVGLQELSEIDIQLPQFGISITLDYLAILQDELAARGLNYVVGAKVANVAVNLEPLPGATIALADYDALLVDASRVQVEPGSVVEQNFSTNIGIVVPGVNIIRGWVSLRATVNGQTILVANSHLESGSSSPILAQIRAAQAFELVTAIGNEPLAIVMGDMNDEPGSLMYDVFTSAALVDSWDGIRPQKAGGTCCHVADLSNKKSREQLTQRIDYVFARGALAKQDGLFGSAELFGDGPNDRVAGPEYRIWPSDHAGVLVELRFPAP